MHRSNSQRHQVAGCTYIVELTGKTLSSPINS